MQQHDNRPDMRGTFNFGYLIVNAHALTLTTFLRTDFGKNALGVYGLGGFAIILFYGGLVCPSMVIYLGLWMVSLLCQRIKQWQNRRKGVLIHSRYNGFPLLATKLFPRMRESNAKGVEAFLCLVVGWLIMQVNPGIGIYVMCGFGTILLSEALIVEGKFKRLQDMRDAEIEQEALAEELKQYRR